MKIAPVLLICLAAAGCGGGEQQERAATPGKTEDVETDLREVFDAYNDALVARDWEGVCERMAPESIASLRDDLRIIYHVNPPEDCSEVWDELTTRGGEKLTSWALDEIGKTAALDSVEVTGDTATLSWHYRKRGQRAGPLSTPARRIDGEWKLMDETN